MLQIRKSYKHKPQSEATKQKLREAWLKQKERGKIGGNPRFELKKVLTSSSYHRTTSQG